MDQQLVDLALKMRREGRTLSAICDATGLLLKEVRLIIDEADQHEQRSTTRPPQPRPAAQPPMPANTAVRHGIDVAELLDRADKSDVGKVTTAAKRLRAAIDNLRQVLIDTEAARKEHEQRQAKAAAARAAIEAAEKALAKARAELAAVAPKKKREYTPEGLENLRESGRRLQALARERRAAQTAGGS